MYSVIFKKYQRQMYLRVIQKKCLGVFFQDKRYKRDCVRAFFEIMQKKKICTFYFKKR